MIWYISNEEKFEKYCYYGFENRETMQDGIIFMSNHNIIENTPLDDAYEIPTSEKVEKLVKESAKIYRQFFRFIYLNDSNEEMERFGRKHYRNKEEEAKGIEEQIRERIDELFKEKKMRVTKAGLFFSKEQEKYFYRDFCYQKCDFERDNAWWIEEVYEMLSYLDNLEKEDKVKYYEKWLLAKYKRAQSRNDPPEKIEIIRNAYEILSNNARKNKPIEKVER